MAVWARRERHIMDLWDAGRSIEQIARQLQHPRRSIRDVITNFHDAGEASADRRAMIAFSAALLDALTQARIAA